jgi:hypothetical protein
MSLQKADVERLIAPSFTEGLADASVAELRERRHECLRVEVVVSYLRRLLQGELDIVRAERELRASGERGDPSRLVEELPAILAGGLGAPGGAGGHRGPGGQTSDEAPDAAATGASSAPRHEGGGAHLSLVTIPGLGEEWGEPWERELDDMIAGALGSDLVELSLPGGALPGANLQKYDDEDLAEVAKRLEENEAALSDTRHQLHQRIDELQAAIVERYKSGAASADSLLP